MPQEAPHPPNAAVSVHDLSVTYGKTPVLSGLTTAFTSGRVHGIIGPNGAGKSTLLAALLGLVPYTGTVLLDGVPTESLSVKERARRIAFVPQHHPTPDDYTGRELVAMGRYARVSRFAALTGSDLGHIDRTLALTGAATWANKPVAHTSGGEQQLTHIARALAQDTPILALDEPTSALDLAHQQRVLDLLQPFTSEANRTVITVLHDITLAARYCDELTLVAPGQGGAGSRVVAQGTPAEVVTPERLHLAYGVEVDVRPSEVTDTLVVTVLGASR